MTQKISVLEKIIRCQRHELHQCNKTINTLYKIIDDCLKEKMEIEKLDKKQKIISVSQKDIVKFEEVSSFILKKFFDRSEDVLKLKVHFREILVYSENKIIDSWIISQQVGLEHKFVDSVMRIYFDYSVLKKVFKLICLSYDSTIEIFDTMIDVKKFLSNNSCPHCGVFHYVLDNERTSVEEVYSF